jgi:hypothetical protein
MPMVLAHCMSGGMNTLAQFRSVVVTTLCDNLPESDPTMMAMLADWVGMGRVVLEVTL